MHLELIFILAHLSKLSLKILNILFVLKTVEPMRNLYHLSLRHSCQYKYFVENRRNLHTGLSTSCNVELWKFLWNSEPYAVSQLVHGNFSSTETSTFPLLPDVEKPVCKFLRFSTKYLYRVFC